jgi:hypothetical protein
MKERNDMRAARVSLDHRTGLLNEQPGAHEVEPILDLPFLLCSKARFFVELCKGLVTTRKPRT